MCGLVGAFGNLNFNQKKMFNHLLQMDVVRGKDSTGIFAVDTKGECEVFKLPITPTDFLETDAAQRTITFADTALFGHNRAATRGKVTRANAHPFQHGPITLMHNGTLRSMAGLQESSKFDTDSEAICYNLSLISKKQVPEFLSKLSGAFALIWHDARDNSVNIVRNDERPLHYMTSTQGTTYFSSELGILFAAAVKEGFDITDNPSKYIKEVPVGVMYTLTYENGKVKNVETKVDLTKKFTPTVINGGGGRGTNTSAYGQSVERLWKLTGLERDTWVTAYPSKWTPSGSSKTKGTLVVHMIEDPYCEVVMFGADKPDMDKYVEIKLAWISATSNGNDMAVQPYDVVINASEWREVIEAEGKSCTDEECVNCGEVIVAGDAYIETDSLGCVCGKCFYGDETVRDLLAVEGINASHIRYD